MGILPLRYNLQGFVDFSGKKDSYLYSQSCSKYYNKLDDLIDEEKNIVVRHFNKYKVYNGESPRDFNLKEEWIYYANLTGFFDEICKSNPIAC